MRDGLPWARVPAWVDPARPWLRNTTHHDSRTADRIARTLTDPPPDQPPDRQVDTRPTDRPDAA